ncbi:MAG: NAD(P)-dependent alcohol dehydrogenase [Saprospiraceae bacterium]
MKKVIYKRYGSIADLELAEVETPSIQPDEILIKVKAVAINPIDWKRLEGQLKIITGSKFPKGIAIDFSGIVEKKGNAISSFQAGDAVFGALDAMKGEALAEYIVVKEANICKKPAAVSFETAAAAVTSGVTALYLFDKSKLKSGDNLLINGASGGVGLSVLQMAKQKGISVTAVASGEGLSFIQKWKPDASIDYKKQNPMAGKTTYNAIFELSGTLPFGKGKAILKPQSMFASTLPNPVDMLKAFFNNLISDKKFQIITANPSPDHYRQLCEWLTQKDLEIPIAKTFSMADFKAAYQCARKGGVVGKVIISI